VRYINPRPISVATILIFADKAENSRNLDDSISDMLLGNMPRPNSKYSRNIFKKKYPSRCKYSTTKDSISNMATMGNMAHKNGALLANIEANINQAKTGNIHSA
jgi:hypothetical protein